MRQESNSGGDVVQSTLANLREVGPRYYQEAVSSGIMLPPYEETVLHSLTTKLETGLPLDCEEIDALKIMVSRGDVEVSAFFGFLEAFVEDRSDQLTALREGRAR